MSGPIQSRIRVEVEFEFPNWFNHTPFGCLVEEPVLSNISPDSRRRFEIKANAVIHKWTMLQISGAELDALCRVHAKRYADSAGIPLATQLYVTCKIESFLMLSRSLLDILSTCLSMWLRNSPTVGSFNDLRKKGDIPQWLSDYATAKLDGAVGETSLSKIGWLTLLVSKSNTERSLRDFVTHQGIASFIIRIFDLEEGDVDLAFVPRPSDEYSYSVVEVKDKILRGIDELAELINHHKENSGKAVI